MPEAPPYVLDPSGFAQDPLATMLQPFDSVFVGFSLVVFWGLLVGILWLRTHNPMLISVIGIVMVAGYLATPEIVYGGTSPQWEQARNTGVVLIAISFAFVAYQIFMHKAHMQPQ